MSIFDFIILGLVAGMPGAAVQMYLYKRERNRQKKSMMWQAWAGLQSELARTLHHPHPESREMDILLERLETFTVSGISDISEQERSRLVELLREKIDDPNQKDEEKIRAEFMIFAMRRAIK